MQNTILFFLITFSIFSCTGESKFDLKNDYAQFSEKIENKDTLEVRVDYSACMYSAFEIYTFYKRNDTLFLKTQSEIFSFDKREQILPEIIYSKKNSDSLSFENFFRYLHQHNKPKKETNRELVKVLYKNKGQTLSFFDDSLDDKFDKLDKISKIRQELYPKDTFFNSPEPPPPPPDKNSRKYN